ncbi:hypothetical protein HAX54_031114, partial [Datura stramonium]|nr:hypothetical protein [Datura stramonium]
MNDLAVKIIAASKKELKDHQQQDRVTLKKHLVHGWLYVKAQRRFYELLRQSERLQVALPFGPLTLQLPHKPDTTTLQVGEFYIYSGPASRRPFIFKVAPPAGGLSTSQLPLQMEAFYYKFAPPAEGYTTSYFASRSLHTTTQHIIDLSVKTVYVNQEQLHKSESAIP